MRGSTQVRSVVWLLSVALLGCPSETPPASPDHTADLAVDQGLPPVPCTRHHDCPQGYYCYNQGCKQDPKYPVYHCGQQDEDGDDTCPPGKWCVEADGSRSTCAESQTYACQSACDCGPALTHKDPDPWCRSSAGSGSPCRRPSLGRGPETR